MRLARVIVFAVAAVWLGPGLAAAQSLEPLRGRTVLKGGAEGPLLRPLMIAAAAEGTYVFDYGDMLLKLVSNQTGEVLWSTGGRGRGPGEFTNPTDMSLSPDGGVWVLDPENIRVSRFSSAGELLESVALPAPTHRLGVTPDGLLLVDMSGSKAFINLFVPSDRGRLVPITMPDSVDGVSGLLREPRVASCHGGGVVVGVMWTGRLYKIPDGETVARSIPAVATGPFPELVTFAPMPNVSARRVKPGMSRVLYSIACDDAQVFVLRGRRDGGSGRRVIDVYDREEGEFVASYLVGPNVVKISSAGRGSLIALETDLFSDLVEYRIR